MSNEERLANNSRLQEAFKKLDADPSATPEMWSELAMEYYVAGYILNADCCFKRGDAIIAEWQKSKFVGVSALDAAVEVV